MSKNLKIAIGIIILVGISAAATLWRSNEPSWQSLGSVLVAAGLVMAIVSRRLESEGAQEIDLRPFTGGLSKLRPFTLLLWGVALAILGLIYLLGV